MTKQTVVRLARKKTGSIESTLEGILLNKVLLSNLDCTEEKKWYQWINNGIILLWCDKVSECINLTALNNQIKSLAAILDFSSFNIDLIITNKRILMTIFSISPDEKELAHIHDRYYTEISTLANVIPLASKNIIVSELDHYEFEAKLILTF